MNKDEVMQVLMSAVVDKINSDGIKMSKQISNGFFGGIYDHRTVYSAKDLIKLNREGFKADTDLGIFLFNTIWTYKPKDKQ